LYVADLRLQLLEPERYPYLYKCLYGVLMLLPQSSAFAALKNRLNSVSNIGLLHAGPRALLSAPSVPPSTHERSAAARIRWVELLDKFKNVQERARRSQRFSQRQFDQDANGIELKQSSLAAALSAAATADQPGMKGKALPDVPRSGIGGGGGMGTPVPGSRGNLAQDNVRAKGPSPTPPGHKSRSGLGNLSRLGIGSRKPKH